MFGKEKLALKEARERDIAKCLKVHDNVSVVLERQWQLLSDLLMTPLSYSNNLFAFSYF